MMISRDIAPMVPRWKCEHPGCDADADVAVRCSGQPIGACVHLCNAHDGARFADFDPPAPGRTIRPPTKASLAVGVTAILIGAGEMAFALAVVGWYRTADMLAPNWAAAFWINGLAFGGVGLVALIILMLIERVLDARTR